MKKIILLLLAAMAIGFSGTSSAQCTITDLGVNIKNFNNTTCQVVFDVTWIQEVNSGNKFANIHLWTVANYHTPAASWAGMYGNPAAYPQAADLVNTLATISILENGSSTPSIGTAYSPDAAVIPISAGLSVVKTPLPGSITERMTIKNIALTLTSCTGVVTIKGDVWASQAANGKNVHCASQGLTFNLNNPAVAGFKICNPRSYTYGITNNGATTITVFYNLYKDDGDNIFEPGNGSGLDGIAIYTSSNKTIAAGATSSEVQLAYPGSTIPGESSSLWMEVITTSPASSFVVIKEFTDPGCIPLPVIFKTFTAERSQANVNLRWTTLSEVENAGFFIERKYGNGEWEIAGFIVSQAYDGNSEEELYYRFTDNNNLPGVSLYRIKLVTTKGEASYSATRPVKGYGQTSDIIIYPNPSANGQLNIVFEKINYPFSVELFDINGRLVRKWMDYYQTRLTITGMLPGVYTLKVFVPGTQEQITGKFIVSR